MLAVNEANDQIWYDIDYVSENQVATKRWYRQKTCYIPVSGTQQSRSCPLCGDSIPTSCVKMRCKRSHLHQFTFFFHFHFWYFISLPYDHIIYNTQITIIKAMDFADLSNYDDLLTDIFLDGLFLWFKTTKVNTMRRRRPRIPSNKVLDIIQRKILMEKSPSDAIAEFLQ